MRQLLSRGARRRCLSPWSAAFTVLLLVSSLAFSPIGPHLAAAEDCQRYVVVDDVVEVCTDTANWRRENADLRDSVGANVRFDRGDLPDIDVDDGEEATLWFDENGTLRMLEIEDDDEEFLNVFDANGTLRLRLEAEEDNGDEEELREVFDADGTLRLRLEEDDDGDERREEFDANGTLRFRVDDDDDGDERERTYDANGTLRVERIHDDDGDDIVRIFDEDGTLVEQCRDDECSDDDFDSRTITGPAESVRVVVPLRGDAGDGVTLDETVLGRQSG